MSSKTLPFVDQQPDPVQVLQQKLHKLEEKYLNFVERCSELLKSEQISNEARDFFSECSSSYCFTPDPAPYSSVKDTQQLIHLLTKLENGTMIKEVMSSVSEVVQSSQDQLFRQFNFPDKVKNKIKESNQTLTAETWQSLFRYENLVQSAVRSSIRKIKDLDKAFEDTLMRSDNRWIIYKDKYKQCKTEKNLLIRKLRDSSEIRNDSSRKRTPEKAFQSTSSQQNMISSRSLVSSPAPFRDSATKPLEMTSDLKSKLKTLPPSALGTKSSLKDRKSDVYEVEKREIQDQLKSLQMKLQGFEKVAKNLIDSSIRAELNIMGKKQEATDKSKSKLYESPDLSIFGSHISILEVDQAKKNIEILEREKENLLAALNAEKVNSHELAFRSSEKDKEISRLEDRVQDFESELEMSQDRYFSLKNKFDECDNSLREAKMKFENLTLEKEKIEKSVQALNESKKSLSEKIKEKDLIIDELNSEINSSKINFSALFEKNKALKQKAKKIKEDKLKIMGFSAKHAENAKNSEENLKNLQESIKKLQESDKILNQKLQQTQEMKQEAEYSLQEYKIRENKLNEKIEELQKTAENRINEAKSEKEKRENAERTFEKQRKNWESQEKEHKNLLSNFKNYEKILESKDEALNSTEEAKKKLELNKKSLEKSLKESQQRESLALSDIEKEKSNYQSLDKEFEKIKVRAFESEQLYKKALGEIQNIREKCRETEELVCKLQETEDNLKVSNNSLLELKKQYESSQIISKDLQSVLQKKESELSSLESANLSCENSLQSLELRNKFLESKLSSLESSKLHLDSSSQALQVSLNASQSQLSDLKLSIHSLELSLSQSQQSEACLKSELLSIKSQSKDQSSQIQSLQSDIKSYQEQVESLKCQLLELDSLKSSIRSLESQIHIKDSLLKQRSNLLSESQIEAANHESVIQSLQFELKYCKTLIENSEKKTERINELEAKEITLNKENHQMSKTIQSIQNELSETNMILAGKTKEESLIRERCQNLVKENEEFLMNLSAKSESLVHSKNVLKKILMIVKNFKVSEIRKQINELKALVNKKNEEIKNFVLSPNHLKNFEMVLMEFTEKNNGLAMKNAGLLITIQKLNLKNEELHKEIAKREEESDILSRSRSESNSKVRELQGKVDNLTSSLQDYEKTQLNLQRNLKTSEESNEVLKRQYDSLNQTHQELLFSNQDLNSQIALLKEKNSQLANDLEVFDIKINEKYKEIISLTEKNDTLKQSLHDLEVSKKESESNKNNQIQVLSEEIQRLTQKMLDFDDLKEQLKINQHESIRNHEQIKELNKKVDDKTKEFELTSSLLNKAKLESEKIFRDHKNLSAENQRLIEIQISTSTEIKTLKDQLGVKGSEIENLNSELDSKQKISEDLKNALIYSQVENEKIRSFSNISRCEKCLSKPGQSPQIYDSQDKKMIRGNDNFLPVPLKSKTCSVSSNANSIKKSIYSEELNLTPVKLLRVIKHAGKKWALVSTEDGGQTWKEESEIPGMNLEEEPDDIEEIKDVLGEYYKGSIVVAIQDLLKKIDEVNYSFHPEDNKFDLISQSFRGEIFEAGLELSKIDIRLQDGENYEQLSQELSARINEIVVKDKKIEKKKRTLVLHKEQIVVLKDQLRKNQEKINELEAAENINLPYLKQVFVAFIIKIKVEKNYEDQVGIMFKILGFSADETTRIQLQRKGGKKLLNK